MGIKLAIADDHMFIVDSIERTLSTTGYMEVSGKYQSGDELIEGLKVSLPDILILDYHFPEGNGGQVTRYVTYHYPDVKIIILTGFDKPGLAAELLECGCMGYLLKSTADTEVLIEAIERVYDGYIYIDKSLSGKFSNINRMQPVKEPILKLTKRELEILGEMAAGLSNPEIAEKLHISRRTVDNHRNSIMNKSGAKNTASLIRLSIELRLI